MLPPNYYDCHIICCLPATLLQDLLEEQGWDIAEMLRFTLGSL
jgi:hypothetical protein